MNVTSTADLGPCQGRSARSGKLSSSRSARLVRVRILPRSLPIHDGESQLRRRRHERMLWPHASGVQEAAEGSLQGGLRTG